MARNNRLMQLALLLLLSVSTAAAATSQPSPTADCLFAGEYNSTVVVLGGTINGKPIEPGDTVSAWYEDRCAGQKEVPSVPFAVSVAQDGDLGAEPGQPFHLAVTDGNSGEFFIGSSVVVTRAACSDFNHSQDVCTDLDTFMPDLVYVVRGIDAGNAPVDSVETAAVWSQFGEGSYNPVITIPDEYYPDVNGVCFWYNDNFNRCDETGPRDPDPPSRVFQMYTEDGFDLVVGDELRAVWTSLDGVRRWSGQTVHCQGPECDGQQIHYVQVAHGDTTGGYDADLIGNDRYYFWSLPVEPAAPETVYVDREVPVDEGFFVPSYVAQGGGTYTVYAVSAPGDTLIVDTHTTERKSAETAAGYKFRNPGHEVWYELIYKVRTDARREN